MKALVFRKSLEFRTDYPVPEPGRDEALVRVKLAGICNTDLEITKGYMKFEGVPGHEFVGRVERSEGKDLEGKRVTGEINIGCGECPFCRNNLPTHCPNRSVLGIARRDGAFAEYVAIPVKNLHIIPDSVSDEEAVFIEPLAAAFEILEQVKIKNSDRVCVLGDGKLGLLVGQVLSLTDCDLVVAGRHVEKLSILEKMGIKTEIVPAKAGARPSRGAFDIAVDCTGSSYGIQTALEITKPRGTIILKTTVAQNVAFDLNSVVINEITIIGSRCGPFHRALEAIEKKSVELRPMISRSFNIEDGVEAFEYASQKGVLKVLLKID
ncbi:MAG: alcohol dehydrogenase catalytic domain-containing protein [Nitrospirae bacterium]|nr:alcohol dehydrogenase catalytic domain-containing protein [Nitrospirota bacterium]